MTSWELYLATMQGLGVGLAVVASIAVPCWLLYLLGGWLMRADYRRWERTSRQAAAQMGTPVIYTTPSAKVLVGNYVCPSCGTSDPNLYIRCNDPPCPDGRDQR
jgi:hypothetical protein